MSDFRLKKTSEKLKEFPLSIVHLDLDTETLDFPRNAVRLETDNSKNMTFDYNQQIYISSVSFALFLYIFYKIT